MNLVSSIRIAYEPLRSLGFVGIGANYAGIGTPFANPIRIISIKNTTDTNLFLSIDGVLNHEVVAANSGIVIDYGSNASSKGGVAELPAGTRWYVKQEPGGGAPAVGSIYVTSMYLSQR